MDDMIDIPISVTQQHIDAGKRNDCGACPIALAILDACPGASSVGVASNFGRIEILPSFQPCCFHVPLEASVFVLDFDEGRDVEPLAFTISLPSEIASTPGFLADESLLSPLELEPMPL